MNTTKNSITIQEDDFADKRILFTYSEEEKQQNEINENNAKFIFSPKFIPIYPELLKRGLTLTEAMIFGFIDFYKSSSSNRFYFTNEQIAEIVQCHPDSVNRAISKLVNDGYIKTSRKIKAGGGQVRFVTDIFYHSELTISTSQNRQFLPSNKNKINKNKINNIGDMFLSLQGINVPTTEEHITSANEHKNSPIKPKKTKYDRNWLDQFIVSNDMAEAEVIASLPSLKDKITAQEIMNIARKMPSWCDAKGKTYTNWRAALINWSEIEIQRQTEKIEAYKKEMRAKGAFFMEDL